MTHVLSKYQTRNNTRVNGAYILTYCLQIATHYTHQVPDKLEHFPTSKSQIHMNTHIYIVLENSITWIGPSLPYANPHQEQRIFTLAA